MDMTLPRRLGPYRLVERIGFGGMCSVFRATAFGASGFEKTVAIKTLRPELRGSGRYKKLLVREARLGARLTHGNLVHVHDFGVDAGEYYLRLEYVDGADAKALTETQAMPAHLALYVCAQLALGLEALHQCSDDAGRPLGLVHRDVSPSNVLISRAGEVKLTDFGVARATKLAGDTHGNIRKGKYAYMSPEQVLGHELDGRSDHFSLGVMLAEWLTGERPYDGEHAMDTLELIQAAAPPDLSAAPEPARAILAACMERSPDARLADDATLPTALMRAHDALRGDELGGQLGLRAWVHTRLE